MMETQRTTSDPQHELFAVLDERGEPTGETKPRGLVHRDGDWHGALHIWVGGVDAESEPFVIFQRRSLTKDTWPGALDVAIGGHIRAGETLAETLREAEEELGLHLDLHDITRIGRRFASDRDGAANDREVQEIFAIRSDLALADYRLHPQEIDGLTAIRISDATRLFTRGTDVVLAREYRRGETSEQQVPVRREDFAGSDTQYPLVVLDALRSVIARAEANPVELHWSAPHSGGT